MRRANQPWRAIHSAVVRWDDEGGPVSATFDDVYYSRDNGLQESQHVFLAGNDLPHRWTRHLLPQFCVGETGFGTGLNFLLTWQAWRAQPEPRPALHYISIEKHPLSRDDIERALATWPTVSGLAQQLLEAYPGLLPGQHRLLFDAGRVTLDLWWADATDALTDLASRERPLIDAWYLDGFAPARNEAMWSTPLLHAIATLSRPRASFATFTAAGAVRRGLVAAGFDVHKTPGYGRKRENLRGRLGEQTAAAATTGLTPWDIPRMQPEQPQSALVIGGGLAGCSTAAALARRGIAVTLLERDTIAGAGSGNAQGILYTKLSRQHSALLDFSLQSFRFALNFYRNLFASGQLTAPRDGELGGYFQLSDNTEELRALHEGLQGLEEIAQCLDAAAASNLLGVDAPAGGYWFPASGWLHPAAVCHALLAHPNISTQEHCGDITLQQEQDQWHARCNDTLLGSASCVVVATGVDTKAQEPFTWLPLQTVRGQTTQLPTTTEFGNLRTALCHEGYIAPARQGRHCIGATFDVHGIDPEVRHTDHGENLSRLADAVPAWRGALAAIDPTTLEGRVGYRCTSPDYLPLVGPAPDRINFLEDFGPLRKNAKQYIARHGSYLPGLYLNTGHGSRGLTSTPLAAEILASTLCGEPPPLDRDLGRALAPARFIIRDLSRNRV